MTASATPPASRPRWWVGVLKWTAIVLSVALIVGIAAVVWAVRRPYPQVSGTIAVPGLSAEVQVVRDSWGIPQVYADNAADLFFAQGFVHAQDRFWEMDFRRHVTAGRLSELFGPDLVETDSFVRTLGWRQVAEAEWELLDPETQAALQSYADGVNAYLADRSPGQLSLEYSVLALTNRGYQVEPWQPVDSIAWLKAMAWDLIGNLDEEIARALAADAVGVARAEQLFPPYPFDRNPVIVADATAINVIVQPTTPVAVPEPATATGGASDAADALIALQRRLAGLPALLGPRGADLGSNSWVVTGEKSPTGLPILANDPHLGPTMPSLWYPMGLHCTQVSDDCRYDVAGMSFSGFPGVIIGHNDRIAWGLTNLGADVSDLVLHAVDGDAVIVDGKRIPIVERTETIEVAGGDDVTITVRTTPDGPILSDVAETEAEVGQVAPTPTGAPTRPEEGYAVALRWTALEPGRSADAVLAFDQAQNWEQFRDAARLFAVPSQNLLYADIEGNIGYQAPGVIPIRGAGDGRYPVPGWDSRYRWTGTVPFEALPAAYNPPEQWIATANNAVVDTREYPYLLTDDWSYGERAARIVERLEQPGPLDVNAMAALQNDSWTALGPMLLPTLQELDVPEQAADAVALWDGWDYSQPVDSAAAAYFNAVWRQLLIATFTDELPEEAWPGRSDRWQEVVGQLLGSPDDAFWDDIRTEEREDRDAILTAALASAAEELRDRLGSDEAAWRWGDLHTLTATNQTFGESGIAPIEALFNRGPVATAGGNSTVDAIGWNPTEGYEVEWVPSMRMITDLADFDRSQWIHLTGASGHAYHPHYADLLPIWARGDYIPFRFSRDEIVATAADTLTLAPN